MTFRSTNHVFTLLVFIVCSVENSFCQSIKQKYAFNSIKKVAKTPYSFEYPVFSSPPEGEEVNKAWVVYSDRNSNNAFTDPNLVSPTKKTNFLDSFYVVKEDKEALELIRCVPGIVAKNSVGIQDPGKIDYVGWIEKSKLLLSQKSFLDPSNRKSCKSVTLLSGKGIFEKVKNYADGESIKVFDGPEFTQVLAKELLFNQIVYLYKSYKDKVLIGRKPSFNSQNIHQVIIGWVPADFVRDWGQRLCVEAKETPGGTRTSNYVFPNKDQACQGTQNSSVGYLLNDQGCGVPQLEKKRSPVYKIESYAKGNSTYWTVQTGAIANTSDRSKSFIYNVNGNKIPFQKLCNMSDVSKKANIVFAINNQGDTKEYLNILVTTLQELTGFFITQKANYDLKFGAVDCSANSNSNTNKAELTGQYTDVMPTVINIVRSGIENKSQNTSIIHGLSNAAKLFKGHEEETNIIVLISSQGDTPNQEIVNKTLKESMLEEIAKNDVRLLFLQPYCGTTPTYADFVQQAKSLLKASAEKALPLKKDQLLGINLTELPEPEFKALLNGPNNIYCLDYPKNSIYQGFLLFPTIGNKIDDNYFDDAIDSLLQQIQRDYRDIYTSIGKAFNGPSSFNNGIGNLFKRFYVTQEAIPSEIGYYFKNIDYNYFIPGYLAYPKEASTSKPFKYTLLLSAEEYEELYIAFKNLHFEVIPPQYEMKNRVATFEAMASLLKRYGIERQMEMSEFISFNRFFNVVAGHWTENPLMATLKVGDIRSTTIKYEDIRTVVDHINRRLALFYSLRNNKLNTFTSNGNMYYWVPEEALP